MKDFRTLGELLEFLRKRRGWSQFDLASALEDAEPTLSISQSTISKIEIGQRDDAPINPALIRAIVRVFGHREQFMKLAGLPVDEAEPVDVAGLIERTIADIEAEDVSEVTKDLLRLALRNERERIQREARERHDSEALDPR
jgi:transcriptional regulator with XRE-family HTH domain